MLVEGGICLERSHILTAVEGRDRLSLNSSLWLLNIVHFVDQMLFWCVLICKISIAATAMEMTDVDRRP